MGISTTATASPERREERRQRAVDSLALGRARDDRFGRIARLARTTLGVHWTSITVLDRDRAFFPAAEGFDIDEMARRDTFCHRTTEDDRLTLVEDATRDPRFADLPAVHDAGIRFYAGMPLRDALGNSVGVFCLYDTAPRTLSDDELESFRDLATWAEQELVASAERTQAGLVQASLLPAAPVRVDDWDVNGACLPALAVGGDFYDYGLTDGILHLGLGDVMGKGAGAALVGAGVRTAFRATHHAVVAGADLGATTTQVARGLATDLDRSGSFACLFQAAVDLADGTMRYVDAGLGLALLVRADGTHERLTGVDRPLGLLPQDRWTEHRARLAPGDRLLVFSDGLIDLLDDPVEWTRPVADLVADHEEVASLISEIAGITAARVATDDVTALAVFRRTSDGPR